MKFIVKLFPEITIKSKPVRKRLVQQLRQNIKIIGQRIDPGLDVKGQWDALQVNPSENLDRTIELQLIDALQSTPGIAHFLEVREYPLGDFDDILAKAQRAFEQQLDGKVFCLRVRRSGQHDFRSIDVERYVGGGLNRLTNAKGVSVSKPEVTVNIEIKDQKLYLVENRYEGLGGFPLGSQDSTLSLVSGGFDSTVASYLMMKRGIRTHFLFFNLGGRAHEIGVKQVALYLWQKFGSSARVKFITVPFEEVVGEILQSVHHSHMGVILKRMMMRAGERVADRMKLDALVTGESIAQVSSQTLPNLKLIDNATDALVIRPLITMDKQAIIDIATDIGTYEFAATMPEFCGVISDRPTTCAKRERVEEEESNFDYDVLDRALEKTQVISIDDIVEDVNVNAEVEALTKVSANQVIIDVRAPQECERKPLNMPGCEVIEVPFFKLESAFEELDRSKEYLLYCDKGVMSQLHAQTLQDKGYENVKVYRPGAEA